MAAAGRFTRVRQRVRELSHRAGFELRRWPPSDSSYARRTQIFASCGVDLLIDVGANDGEYARRMRAAGYAGRIVSFEPLTVPFEKLARDAANDPLWDCLKLALGDNEGKEEIHVSGNVESSSFLPMTGRHVESMPTSAYVGTETVERQQLDTVFPQLRADDARVYLKLDVQGYEGHVLRGAMRTLEKVVAAESETSLVTLYVGQPSLQEMLAHFRELAFRPVFAEPHFFDPRTGHAMHLDFVFVRADATAQAAATG